MASYNEIPTTTLARLIPRSYRQPFMNVGDLAESLKDKQVIIYCQKGLKISQGAAAILRNSASMLKS